MTNNKMNERELAINIQILQEQAKILASNVEMLSMYLQELATSKLTLEGIKNLTKGDEILVPIGASSFVRARIDDTAQVIAGIGANVSVDRSIDDATKNLEERITLIEAKINENQENYMNVAERLEELTAQARALMGEKGENV
ncbi:MAG: prefoldin subunit alpha [Theionarchaea archaeon]|nr:prefoldin subunit alpha [Theionarchaea archaeon]